MTLSVEGFGPVMFCHAVPDDDEQVVLVDTRLSRWAEVLAALPDDVTTLVCGHTHMPFVRLAHRRLIVNPGSVGMPYGRPGAHWALLADGAVTLRRTMFDVAAARAEIVAAGSPLAQEWVKEYLDEVADDAEAIEVVRPTGREISRRDKIFVVIVDVWLWSDNTSKIIKWLVPTSHRSPRATGWAGSLAARSSAAA